MVNKNYLKSRPVCKVTFSFIPPGNPSIQNVFLVGDFNSWNTQASPMASKKEKFEITIELTPGHEYHFRYFVDGSEWYNDDKADRYALNSFGTYNSVISI